MNSDFDDKIVGKSNNDYMMRMEEEYNKNKESEMEEERKPIDERVKSKNWKIRKNAYNEIFDSLKNAESRNDILFTQYEAFYIPNLDDQHAAAQETALDIVKLVIEKYDGASNLAPELFKAILEKCATSNKASLKNKAKEALTGCLEISNDSKAICEVIKTALDSKNPKVQTAAINILTYLISVFGAYKIEYRGLIANAEKLTEATTPAIRNEALEFYKELYKWIKDAIKSFVSKLKDVHQKDLEKAFEEISAKNSQSVPTKFLKNDKLKSSKINNPELNAKMLQLAEEEKLFKFTEAIELFQGKFNEDWTEQLLAKERKWLEKKEMLESFINASNDAKIKPSGRSHIIAALVQLLKDSNVNVVNSAILTINNIAKGLRKDFSEAKEFCFTILEKLKDRKFHEAGMTCLENIMFYCITLDDIIDDLKFYNFNDKANLLKEKFSVFVEKTILKTYIGPLKKHCKTLAEILFKLSDDPSPEVRNSALKALGVLKFRVGEMPISKVLNAVPDLKRAKIEEGAQNVFVEEIYDKDDTIPVVKGVKKLVKNNSESNILVTNNFAKSDTAALDVEMTDLTDFSNKTSFKGVVNEIEMTPISENVIVTKPNTVNTVKPNNLQKSQSTNNLPTKATKAANNAKPANPEADVENEDDSNMNNEEIEAIIKEKLGAEKTAMFVDSKWEIRKNAFVNLAEYVSNNSEEMNKYVDIALRFIKIKLKDYKENNFNIIKEALNVIQILCEQCNNFAKKHCGMIIKKTCEKLSDTKLKTNIVNIYIKFMEYHGPKYITNILIKQMNNVKSPGVLKEFSIFLEKVIEDFGINLLPIKEMAEYAKVLASNANPQLRSGATSLLCSMYKYVGPNIKKFLNDIKEATLKVIESEFEKVTVCTESSTGKRELKGAAMSEAQASTGANMMDTLFPRVDISKKITPKILKELTEGKWQIKKAAIEQIEKILSEANMRILPNGLSELITNLKNNLGDGNKNLVRIIVQFITKFIETLGPSAKLFSKTLMNALLNNLSDKMNLLREDVVKCLEKWAELIGFENVLAYLPTYLIIDNFELRTDLLKLIFKYKTSLAKYDTKELIPGVLSILQDKNPSIRTLGEELAKEMLKLISINNFYLHMKDFKPAKAEAVKSIIEKYSSLICTDQDVNINADNFKQPDKSNSAKPVNHVNKGKPNNQSQQNQQNAQKEHLNQSNKNKRDASNENSKEKAKKGINKPLTANINNASVINNIKVITNNTITAEIPANPVITQIKVHTAFLLNSNIKLNQKNRRLENEKKLTFPNEFITQSFDSILKSTMENFINKSFIESSYSGDVTKYNNLFTVITATMKTEAILFFEVSDLILKWILIRNIEMNNDFFFNNIIFEFVKSLIDFLKENESNLHDLENKILIEILISKIFTVNSNYKIKAKSFFSDLSSSKIIKFDTFIEAVAEKFVSVYSLYDTNMKIDILEILKIVANINAVLENPNKIINILNLFENTKDECKNIIAGLIKVIYNANEDTGVMKEIIVKHSREISRMLNLNTAVENKHLTNTAPRSNYIDKSIFSKSPILDFKRKDDNANASKESFNIKLVDLVDQDKINRLLETLYMGNMNEKNKVLIELNDIFTNKLNECVIVLEKNISVILRGFKDLLQLIFSQVLNQDLLDSLKYLLNVYYKVSLTKDIIEITDIETVYNTYEEILKSILYEGLENLGQQEEGKKIIKSLNALMLKLMENCNINYTFTALIKIIQNYRMDNSRICSLGIKCLLKLSNIIPSLIDNIDIEQLLFTIFEFIYEFERTNPDLIATNQNEEMCLKLLRALVNEIIKIKNEGIWNYYRVAIENKNLPDKYLRRWIQMILRSKNGLSVPLNFNALSNASNFTINTNNNTLSPVLADNKIKDNSLENELKFYFEKLTTAENEQAKEKIFCEIMAIVKRNNLPVDALKDKLPETDYNHITKLFHSLANSNHSKSETLSNVAVNKVVSNFSQSERIKENLLPQFNSAVDKAELNNSSNNSYTSNFPQIKTLQEYRNRFHGITAEKPNTEKISFAVNNNASPSPIRVNTEEASNNDNRKQLYDNFLKNKEILKKREFSSEVRNNMSNNLINSKETNFNHNNNNSFNDNNYTFPTNPGEVASTTQNPYFNKLEEMKKRLQQLRAHK